jgi:predicted nucleic acid-binding protein
MEEVINIAEEIKQTGIKEKDATHLACSMISECEYFITTDKRLLKYKNPRINIVNPIDFVRIWRETI